MREYKILFTGTTGAGKTTAIKAVSETAPVVTDVANTDSSIIKKQTTVGLDFGLLTLDNGDRIRLFGTPGQGRFSFLWSILAVNAIGMIILIDNSRPDPRADLKMYLDAFAKYLASIPCVIGVGRIDTNPHPNIDEYADLLALRNLPLPVIDVDVRQREDVILMIDMLLAQIEVNMMELGNA
jgi:small GTP-binding protein